MRRHVLLLPLVVLIPAIQALGVQTTVRLRGVVTTSEISRAPWGPQATVGATASLTYSYDTQAANTNPGNTIGFYPTAVGAFTLTIGSQSVSGSGGQIDVRQATGFGMRDQYNITGLNCGNDFAMSAFFWGPINSDTPLANTSVVMIPSLQVWANTLGNLIDATTNTGIIIQWTVMESPNTAGVACCNSVSGACALALSAQDCVGLGGIAQSANTCSTVTCPQPVAPSGACCLGAACTFGLQSACVGGGAWQGAGAVCRPVLGGAEINRCCRVDFDANGTANVTDIFGFLAAWFASCP